MSNPELSPVLGELAKKSFQSVCAVALGLALVLAPTASDASRDSRFLPAKMNMPAPSAAKNLCTKYSWACSSSKGAVAALTQQDISLVHKVNKLVNRKIREVSDKSQYRKIDYWTLPASYRGDCEDIALLKKRELVSAC